MTRDALALVEFAKGVFQDVLLRAEASGGEDYLESEFTRWALESLSLAGEIDDEWDVSHFQARGTKASGYGLSNDGDTLFIAVTSFTGSPGTYTLAKSEMLNAFRRSRAFVEKLFESDFSGLEESSPAYGMVDQITAWLPTTKKVRIYLLTNGTTDQPAPAEEEHEGRQITYQVWDIVRFFRCLTSGRQQEEIEFDIAAIAGEPLPFLRMPASSEEYSCFLLMLPGTVLADIYGKFGTRLLERNVRAFLQARGKVNKGIRETLLHQPDRFLPYNNGISATGGGLEFATGLDGSLGIARIKDFQIVNGGQTTASLFHAVQKDKADISKVAVQAKLTIVNGDLLDELVPLISRYANSQNKVNEADFSANDPFHVAIENMSRTLWAPPRRGEQRQTRWFYERARGQYADAASREGTTAKRRDFQKVHPPRQKFTKTDLAKFENSWNQLPFFVARGAEKNFREFAIRQREFPGPPPDDSYFRRLIAKAILWRELEGLVTDKQFGGYRSQIVTYSLAFLSHVSAMRVNLEAIWDAQQIDDSLRAFIDGITEPIRNSLTNPPGGQNIAEWCKKEDAWDEVKRLSVRVPDAVTQAWSGQRPYTPKSDMNQVSESGRTDISSVVDLGPNIWYSISAWAKETNNLHPWQRSLAFSLGKLIAAARTPSEKQAKQGLILLGEARRLGYSEDLVNTV